MDETVNAFFSKGLFAIGKEKSADELLTLVMELRNVNLKCMEILESANIGTPVPTKVTCQVEPGPFIVINGHDLHDLQLLLEQTEGKGINILLPAANTAFMTLILGKSADSPHHGYGTMQ